MTAKTFEAIEEIAQRKLRLPTLESRGSDRLDFPENIAVWQLREALFIAHEMGRTGKTLDEAAEAYADAVAP